MSRLTSLAFLVALLGCDSDKSESAAAKTDATAKADENPAGSAEAKSDGPANPFSEYKLKSMATEAKVQVRMIADSARMLAGEMEVGADMQPSSALPTESAPMTPEAGSCCKQPKGVCVPDATTWAHPTWKKLMFSPADPLRYSYEFVAGDKSFTARAVGDLDRDGVLSKYEVVGTIGEDGTASLADVVIENPIE